MPVRMHQLYACFELKTYFSTLWNVKYHPFLYFLHIYHESFLYLNHVRPKSYTCPIFGSENVGENPILMDSNLIFPWFSPGFPRGSPELWAIPRGPQGTVRSSRANRLRLGPHPTDDIVEEKTGRFIPVKTWCFSGNSWDMYAYYIYICLYTWLVVST